METLTLLTAPFVVASFLAKRKLRESPPETETVHPSAPDRPMIFEAMSFTSSGGSIMVKYPSAPY